MINIGLIGCGFMGRMHGEVYGVVADAKLVAACDLNLTAAEGIARPHDAQVTADFNDLLSNPSIDAIDICLPTFLHAEYTIRALEAGKHVFCEKPMALNLEEADRMIAAAKASGRKLMIGHCIRFWPEYALLKELAQSQALGKLKSINLTRYGAFPTWSANGWLEDEKLAGGGALDMHIHDTDYALYLLGKPDHVHSRGTIDAHGVSHIFTTATWGDVVGQLEGGWNLPSCAPFKMAFRAVFERGAAIMDGGAYTVYEDGKEPVTPEVPKMASAGQGGNISDLGGYFFELDYFVRSISENRPLEIVTPESSRASLELTLEEIRQVKAAQPVGATR